MDCKVGDESEDGVGGQTSPGDKAETNTGTNRHQHPWNWEAVMEGSEGLAYDDPQSATITGVDGSQGPELS